MQGDVGTLAYGALSLHGRSAHKRDSTGVLCDEEGWPGARSVALALPTGQFEAAAELS
jgi:hypothetical protein